MTTLPFAHSRLTRRNADLPTLEVLDAGLRHSSSLQRAVTALLPFATLAVFALACHTRSYLLLPLIVLAHFVFTVAYLHDVAHGSAGLNARQTHWSLFVIGVLMLQSGHAFRYSHLFHHTHCLEDEDMEGAPAHMSLGKVLLTGPVYLPRLWIKALREAGPRERRWIAAELGAAMALAGGAALLANWSLGPLLYCTFVYVGGWGYPLATAYLPHYKPGTAPLDQARTLRGTIVPVLFMNLTYHLEHHLYPQVPSMNLRRLALRLDPLLAARGRVVLGASRFF
ncbi:MAG: fatty acid desaturase [Pseudomonadota bacterium]